MSSHNRESIVLIGGEGAVALTLAAMFASWPIEFRQADFSDSDGTMRAVNSASLILVAVDEEDSGPALACCGILKEYDSGISAPVAVVTPERTDAVLRLAALRAGADDVIGLENNVSAAAARISALLRYHTLQEEAGMGKEAGGGISYANGVPDETVRVLVVAENAGARQDLLKSMLSLTATVATGDLTEALYLASRQSFDLVLVHGGAELSDALRICGQLRCIADMRFVPLFALAEPGGDFSVTGDSARHADDCMAWPGETGELVLRSLLHLRRRRYLDTLNESSENIATEVARYDAGDGLLAPERFAATLNSLRRDAGEEGAPLFMGVIRVPEDIGEDTAQAVASLIRTHLQGREAASRVEAGLFAILYPDRQRDDAESAIDLLRSRLDARWQKAGAGGATAPERQAAIRTALMDVG